MPSFYREQPIPVEAIETKRKVTEVEFLIHPAFQMLTNMYANIKVKKKPDSVRESHERTAKSLDLAIERAKTSYEGKNKLMIAFLLGRPKHLKDQQRLADFDAYNQRIGQLRDALKEKLIVISDGDSNKSTAQMGNHFRHIIENILNGTKHKIKQPEESPNKSIVSGNNQYIKDVVEGIKKIAAARGFEIDQQATSKAFGEEALACVREGGANLNRGFGFKNKTVVLPELTELSRDDDEGKKAYNDQIEGYREKIGSQKDSKYVRFKKLGEAE